MATQQQAAPAEGNLLQAIEMVAKEKGIDRSRLVKTVEEAILKAAQSVFGPNRELQATFNEESGQVDLFQFMTVVDAQIQRGREDGSFRTDVHPRVLSSAMLGCAEGMVRDRILSERNHETEHPFTDADILRTFSAMVDGLGPER